MAETEKRKRKMSSVPSLEVDFPEEGKAYPAKVTGIERGKAVEVYGPKAEDPDALVATLHFDDGAGIAGRHTLSYRKVPHPKSKLYSFVKRYGAPKVGMNVQVEQDGKGFWRLVL